MSARPDNCGNCLTLEHAVTVHPYLVRPEGEKSVRAYYLCLDCGFGWTTSFLLPVTAEQAEFNARLLDEAAASWEAAHADEEEGTAA